MVQLWIAIESTLDIQAAVIDVTTKKVWSMGEKKFTDNPTDAWVTLARFPASDLASMRTATVNIPETIANVDNLMAVYRFVGDTMLIGDPVPVAKMNRAKSGIWGAWLW